MLTTSVPARWQLQSAEQARGIFDGAPDLVTSRQWIRIQRPFTGSVSSTQAGPQYQDVRDVTEIALTETSRS